MANGDGEEKCESERGGCGRVSPEFRDVNRTRGYSSLWRGYLSFIWVLRFGRLRCVAPMYVHLS